MACTSSCSLAIFTYFKAKDEGSQRIVHGALVRDAQRDDDEVSREEKKEHGCAVCCAAVLPCLLCCRAADTSVSPDIYIIDIVKTCCRAAVLAVLLCAVYYC
jgi:hypothetical protein